MPEVGEIRRSKEIGRKGHDRWCFLACSSCGHTRWVPECTAWKPELVCKRCAGIRLNQMLAGRRGRPLKRISDEGLARRGELMNVPCPDCGSPRWVKSTNYCDTRLGARCYYCAAKRRPSMRGVLSPRWKGGKQITPDGYVAVALHTGNPYFGMASRSGRSYRVLEHRLVMAKHLGRCLESWEVVHHKGVLYPEGRVENRSDNRIENLELLPGDSPNTMYSRVAVRVAELEGVIGKLELRVKDLEAQNRLLRWQVSNLRQGNPEPNSPNEYNVGEKCVETRADGTQPDNAHSASRPC